MANRRMIARNVALSKKLAIVKWSTEVLYYRGLPFTDDAGRMTADPEEYRALLIPLGKNGKTIPRSQIEAAIRELYEVGLIGICECSREKCLEYTSFTDHQTIKKEVGRKSQIHCSEPVGFQWFPKDSKGNPVRARGKGREVNLREGEGEGAPAREAPSPQVLDCIEKAREIKGWNFSRQEDEICFERLLEAFPLPLVLKSIEDLRFYQVKPTRDYKNLQSALRNWCNKEAERHPVQTDETSNPVRRPLTLEELQMRKIGIEGCLEGDPDNEEHKRALDVANKRIAELEAGQ
jgi:hypothetical protein